MTCLQKVERTLDVLEISQIKKPGLVLAMDEEVPDFEISVANFSCSMAVNSMQHQIYVTKKNNAVRCEDACFFNFSAPTAVEWPHPKAVKYNFMLNDHFSK